jgi:hypothetical protein
VVRLTGFEPFPRCGIRERLDLDVVAGGVLDEEAVDGDSRHHGWFVQDLDLGYVLQSLVPRVDVVDGDRKEGARADWFLDALATNAD